MDNTNPYAELEQKYANNINQQNDLLNQQSNIQTEQSKANTEQVINEIEQQRKYAQQDFNKEARGAYQDYKKLTNPYGVQAENVFSNGLGNSGYSETSKLNAFNTYQNRYATARESTDRLMEDFNNQITEAKLSGNKELAEIALNKLQTQMDNLWNQLSFDTNLTSNKVNYDQWLKQFEYQKQQDEIANAFAREQFEYQKQQDAIANSYRSSSSSSDDYFNQILADYLASLNEEENNSGNSNSTNTQQNKTDKNSVLYQKPSSSRLSIVDVGNNLAQGKIPTTYWKDSVTSAYNNFGLYG